jgi:threonine dehydrogenase-like Zn-dependent dehydrogenase
MKGKMACLVGTREIVIKQFDLPPEIEPGGILLKVVKANVCGSDLHVWQGHHPIVKKGSMGHEFIGQVSELGPGVETDCAGNPLNVGDRVVPAYFITCCKCSFCLRGDFTHCQNAFKYVVIPPETPPHFNGAFATHYYMHPNQYFYKVPDSIPDSVAAGANCALPQVIYGLDKARIRAGEILVIQGAGGLGLYATAVAKEMGANVVVIDGVKERLEFAKAFGADYILDISQLTEVEDRVKEIMNITGGDGADMVLEVAGVPSAFGEALQLVRPMGKVVEIGNILFGPEFTVPVEPGVITRKGISIYGFVRYEPWYIHKAFKFLERNHNKYPFEQFSEQEYTLDEINDALELSEKRTMARAVISPGS